MGGAGSKRKGSGFERLVAKRILLAAGPRFERKDCYRTPQSGGHEFAGQSDLIMSQRLMDVFPFCVECKHRRNFHIEQLLSGVQGVLAWHRQARFSAKRDKFKRCPLLVIRGNGGNIFACAKSAHFQRYDGYLADVPGVVYYVACMPWKAVLLEDLLDSLAVHAKNR